MKVRYSAVAVPAVFIILAIVSSVSAQNSSPTPDPLKRSISEKDLFNFVWTADPQISPDGLRAVFTRVVTDEKHTGYETSIWIVPTSGNEAPLRLTNGKHDAHARWSPDGTRMAFIRAGEKDDSGKPRPAQIAILSLTGRRGSHHYGFAKRSWGSVWSPDSKHVAFLSSTTPEDIEKEQHKKKVMQRLDRLEAEEAAAVKNDDADRESDIHIITRAVYRDNDEGYLDFKRHDHIWVIEVPTTRRADQTGAAYQWRL